MEYPLKNSRKNCKKINLSCKRERTSRCVLSIFHIETQKNKKSDILSMQEGKTMLEYGHGPFLKYKKTGGIKMKDNMKKMQIGAVVAVVVCFVLLIAGMALGGSAKLTQKKTEVTVELGSMTQLSLKAEDFFEIEKKDAKKVLIDTSKVDLTKAGEYEATATYKNEKYTIKVKVVDTTAPKVELTDRVVFTNDIEKANAGIAEILASVADASEYTTKLIRFEKKDVLSTMDSFAVGKLEEAVNDFRTKEEALAVGMEEIPTQPGIYRSVMEVADVHGNATYKEVYVVLDKTGATFNDMADMTVSVPAEKINNEPVLDRSIFKGYDEVDGILTSDKLAIEVLLTDETKHEWTVSVAYTDRAGNTSESGFLITVTEEKKQTVADNNQKPSGNTNNNTGNGQGNSNTPGGNTSTGNNNTQYDPADTNKDGYVTDEEAMHYITPEKQAIIDAGYGVVVELHGGEMYAVLMKDIDHTIDGKDGRAILREYLNAKGKDGHISGCWINPENEWYWFTAEDIYEKPVNDVTWGEIEDF